MQPRCSRDIAEIALITTGEAVKTAIVESISVEGARLHVQCVDDEPIDLDDGDHVSFSEVMTGNYGSLHSSSYVITSPR